MAAWKRICCPVDFTWESHAAMEEAAELAWRFGSELALLHVVAPPRRPADEGGDAERRAEDELSRWVAEAEPIATTAVTAALRSGSPAEEIVRFAREGRHDVIVMGTRADPTGDHWTIGSVVQAVVRSAPCTVVVARGRPPARVTRPPPA